MICPLYPFALCTSIRNLYQSLYTCLLYPYLESQGFACARSLKRLSKFTTDRASCWLQLLYLNLYSVPVQLKGIAFAGNSIPEGRQFLGLGWVNGLSDFFNG
jgi:hypothetical protein